MSNLSLVDRFLKQIIVTTLLVLPFSSNCKPQTQVEEQLNLIIDADTANEVDDLNAIVRAKQLKARTTNLQREITIHTTIDVSAMKTDFWNTLKTYIEENEVLN